MLDTNRITQNKMRGAVGASWLLVATTAAVLVGEIGEFFGLIDLDSEVLTAAEVVYSLLLVGNLVVFVASVVFVGRWILQAHKNLRNAGYENEFTPGWALGWFFVPLMNLFKPFQGGVRRGGTGLGLAIAAELVKGHGGRLELVRTSAEGTEFRIFLPVQKAEAA